MQNNSHLFLKNSNFPHFSLMRENESSSSPLSDLTRLTGSNVEVVKSAKKVFILLFYKRTHLYPFRFYPTTLRNLGPRTSLFQRS